MKKFRYAEQRIDYHTKSLIEANKAVLKTVREKMAKKGIRLVKLASHTGVKLHTITNWFYNGGIPPLQTIEKIWHFLR
jgi:DNA-binding phage protein